MALTQYAVLYDANGQVVMTVIPNDDSDLDDPAYNPPNAGSVTRTLFPISNLPQPIIDTSQQ
jgi:hypothetical protein